MTDIDMVCHDGGFLPPGNAALTLQRTQAWADFEAELIAESGDDITRAISGAVMVLFTPSFAVIGSATTASTDAGISVPTTIGISLAAWNNFTQTDLAAVLTELAAATTKETDPPRLDDP